MKRRQPKNQNRRGLAVAEAAFCIPMILLLAFGTLEISKLIFVKEKATICAFEGARLGVKRRAQRPAVEQLCTELLADFGVHNAQITVTPNDFSTLRALDPITVTVRIPLTGSASLMGTMINQTHISSTVRMVREFDE